MRNLVVGLVFGIFTIGLMAQVAPKQKVKQILLEYKSSNKTLVLKDTSIVITEKKDVFDNPTSSIPSSSTFENRSYTLTKKEVYDIIKFIQESKFFDLQNAYGAPEAERHYPTTILIKMHGKEKEIIYRSNPSFESAPDAFRKIETYVLNLRK